MKPEDIEKLVGILADREHDRPGYLKDLADRSNLPKEWLGEISWDGASRTDARLLINMALSRGLNNNDPRFSSLGSILSSVLNINGESDVGHDIGVEIAIFIIRYKLYNDASLIEELKANKNLLEQLYNKYQVKEFDDLKEKISVTQKGLISEDARNNLIKILEKIIDSNEEEGLSVVKDACRKALPRSQRHQALSVDGVEQALNLLDIHATRNNEISRIITFVTYLSTDEDIISNVEIANDIDLWFSENDFEKASTFIDRSSLLIENPEPRLFILISEDLLDIGKGAIFSVQAWLVPHLPCVVKDREDVEKIYKFDDYYVLDLSYLFSIYEDEISGCISNSLLDKITKTEIDGAIHIKNLRLSLEEIKELTSLFLNESLLILSEERSTNPQLDIDNLTIELFLPDKLLCYGDFDRWIVSNLLREEDPSCMGTSFKVLLHNSSRFTKRQSKKTRLEAKKAKVKETLEENPWKVNWSLAIDKLQVPIESDEFESIDTATDLDTLQFILRRKIGVVLGQTAQRDEVLKSITKAGIPIVIWTRHDNGDADHLSEMQTLVCSAPLIYLPERVLNKRQEAIQQSDNHLGNHLAILWDDPNRFPPSDDNLKLSV
jgi:hypothetical protein